MKIIFVNGPTDNFVDFQTGEDSTDSPLSASAMNPDQLREYKALVADYYSSRSTSYDSSEWHVQISVIKPDSGGIASLALAFLPEDGVSAPEKKYVSPVGAGTQALLAQAGVCRTGMLLSIRLRLASLHIFNA